MAVVTVKSAVITNRDAVPPVINDGRLEKSNLKTGIGSVAVGAADSATSYYPLVSVPSSAVVRAVYATCVAGMTTLAGDIGVFKTTKDSGGAALGTVANTGSGTLFATAQSFAAALNRSDVTNESGTYTTLLREMPLWQAIGLTVDPQTYFDIGVTVTTANTGAAGRLGIEVEYCDNSN
jgi:autotransporter adhesin